MRTNRSDARSPLFLTATLSVCALVGVSLWSVFGNQSAAPAPSVVAAATQGSEADTGVLVKTIADRSTSQPAIDVADVGPMVVGTLAAQYSVLKNQGTYTPEAGAAIATELGQAVTAPVSYKHYAVGDIHTTDAHSYNDMLTYRASLKDALAPLVKNKDPEIGFFAGYVQTHDPTYLDTLRSVAADYASARDAAAALTVPKEAAALHAGILNAMGEFGATLQALADNANDPITSTALLETYNDGEQNMVTSFNNLAMYYAHHPQP